MSQQKYITAFAMAASDANKIQVINL